MSIKSRTKETKVMSKGRYSKPLESKPKDSEGDIRMDNLKDMFYTTTIMDNMERIMTLVNENKQLKRDRYGR